MSKIKLSALDLVTVNKEDEIANAIHKSVSYAQLAEALDFERYWLAEHHNMPNVASSATAVLIGHIAGLTQKIRVGSGGIMLPNHSTLMVAEQFGTLGSIYKNRIDLGLGRAPGTDALTAMTIRGKSPHMQYDFKQHILQLQQYFSINNASAKVRAIPGEGVEIPLYILGSSTESAFLAAEMGLPYAFAAHFAPTHFVDAMQIYHTHFRPSPVLKEPYVIACIQILIGKDKAHAQSLSTCVYRNFLNIIKDTRTPLEPPIPYEQMKLYWTEQEKEYVQHMLHYAIMDDEENARRRIFQFLDTYPVNELMTMTHVYYPEDKMFTFEKLKNIMDAYNEECAS
jgi:luciferase family oxidoreductase group 1